MIAEIALRFIEWLETLNVPPGWIWIALILISWLSIGAIGLGLWFIVVSLMVI